MGRGSGREEDVEGLGKDWGDGCEGVEGVVGERGGRRCEGEDRV